LDDPQLKDDSDLLSFFRGIINSHYLSQDDLFVDGITAIGLKAKVVTFGKQLEANAHNDRLRFYSDVWFGNLLPV